MSLYEYQKKQEKQLINSLYKNRIVYDTSEVGSGKTYVTSSLIKQMTSPQVRNTLLNAGIPSDMCNIILGYSGELWFEQVIILCPKSLRLKWQRVLCSFGITNAIIHTYSTFLTTCYNITRKTLIVADEGHIIRNDNQTSNKLLSTVLRFECRMLVISATLLDTPEQEYRLKRMFNLHASSTVSMDYSNSLPVFVTKRYMIGNDDELRMATTAYMRLYRIFAQEIDERRRQISLMQKLCKATMLLHRSYHSMTVGLINELLENNPNNKIVVIIPFIDTMKRVADEFPNISTMMIGKNTEAERKESIDRFQAFDTTTRIMITNAKIGSVGIDLDDKHGEFPRHIIYYPTYSSIDLFQSIGRVRRADTRSAAHVHILFHTISQVQYPRIQNKLLDKMMMMDDYTESSIPQKVINSSDVVEQGPLPRI